jgi:hypothetical protein
MTGGRFLGVALTREEMKSYIDRPPPVYPDIIDGPILNLRK